MVQNCGCPSNAVSGGDRSGGAALMRHPDLVAQCVEAMSEAVTEMATILDQPVPCRITVKHRLGVADAATYNAEFDKSNPYGEDEAYENCHKFVRLITIAGDVSKIQIHARLGLLGEFDPTTNTNESTSLWVPGRAGNSDLQPSNVVQKIDHKRVQYQAKKRARKATIQNRSVPPLRHRVVERIAAEFPSLQVISNGGIRTMDDIQERLSSSSNVIGAMVGRAVINHPCSFGNVDTLWLNSNDSITASSLSRMAVLLDYIEYCKQEEERFLLSAVTDVNPQSTMATLRRRLVGVPFHLFAGEVGNEAYQRRIRKLTSRVERHTSYGILNAALAEIPIDCASKPINEFSTSIDEIPIFDASYQRSGPLQRIIF